MFQFQSGAINDPMQRYFICNLKILQLLENIFIDLFLSNHTCTFGGNLAHEKKSNFRFGTKSVTPKLLFDYCGFNCGGLTRSCPRIHY